MCVCGPGRKAGRSIVVPVTLLAWRKEAVEVGSREKEKEVPLQRSECEGDLRLVSSSRLSLGFLMQVLGH